MNNMEISRIGFVSECVATDILLGPVGGLIGGPPAVWEYRHKFQQQKNAASQKSHRTTVHGLFQSIECILLCVFFYVGEPITTTSQLFGS